jgi:hypothetical protein
VLLEGADHGVDVREPAIEGDVKDGMVGGKEALAGAAH